MDDCLVYLSVVALVWGVCILLIGGLLFYGYVWLLGYNADRLGLWFGLVICVDLVCSDFVLRLGDLPGWAVLEVGVVSLVV